MSNPNAVPMRAIPTGILVSPRPKVCPSERPAPRRKIAPRGRARQVPWLWVVTGASVAWAAVVLTIGLCAEFREPARPSETQASVESVAMSAPATTKLAIHEPAVERKGFDTEVVSEPTPTEGTLQLPVSKEQAAAVARLEESQRVQAPKLPFREVQLVRKDDMPPALPVDLEIQKTIVREKATPPAPQREKAPAWPAFNDLNPSVFASCTQVGTGVNLMKDPTEAFKKARAENKLVFMINLSGNLEDQEFT
jgi:hypothetical protein